MNSQNAIVVTPISAPTTPLSSTTLSVGNLPNVTQLPQIRDPEWLKLEICREFQRGGCTRSADECRYAHPPRNVQTTPEGKVIACYDALKGKCSRESCKYLHPTPQLKQQLETNGKQALMQNRAMLQQMLPLQPTAAVPNPAALPQTGLVGYEQMAAAGTALAAALPASHYYSPALATAHTPAAAYSVLQHSDLASLSQPLLPYYQIATAPQVAAMLPSTPGGLRADKLEVCRDYQRGNCTRGETECRYAHPADRSMIDTTDNTVTVCMDCIKGRCTREKCKYFHPPAHLQAKIRAAQNPNAGFLSSITPTVIPSPQPAVMTAPKRLLTLEDSMTTGNALGQPPIKRHAIDTTMITSGGSVIGNSSVLTSPSSSSQQTAIAALYGYSNSAPAGLSPIQPHNLQPSPGYYQQAIPLLHLQYGAAAGALTAAAQTAPITALSLPTTSAGTVNPNPPSYAFYNGQNQIMLK